MNSFWSNFFLLLGTFGSIVTIAGLVWSMRHGINSRLETFILKVEYFNPLSWFPHLRNKNAYWLLQILLFLGSIILVYCLTIADSRAAVAAISEIPILGQIMLFLIFITSLFNGESIIKKMGDLEPIAWRSLAKNRMPISWELIRLSLAAILWPCFGFVCAYPIILYYSGPHQYQTLSAMMNPGRLIIAQTILVNFPVFWGTAFVLPIMVLTLISILLWGVLSMIIGLLKFIGWPIVQYKLGVIVVIIIAVAFIGLLAWMIS